MSKMNKLQYSQYCHKKLIRENDIRFKTKKEDMYLIKKYYHKEVLRQQYLLDKVLNKNQKQIIFKHIKNNYYTARKRMNNELYA